MGRLSRLPLVVGPLLLLAPRPLAGQDDYEIQVYGAELVPKGSTVVELHTNYAFGAADAADDALHETVEVTHGFAHWFEVGAYAFTAVGGGAGWQYAGSHLRPRLSVPGEWRWPVGVSLSQEIGYLRPEFAADTWTWELRPIVDRQAGRWYWSLNGVFALALAGTDAGHGFSVGANAQVAFDVSGRVNAALEYYGDFGLISDLHPVQQTPQQLFPAVNLDLGPAWEFNAGLGFGLTKVTSGVLAKVILGRRIGG